MTKLWKLLVIAFAPKGTAVKHSTDGDEDVLTLTNGNRELRLTQHPHDCVQRDFVHLDKPEFVPVAGGKISIQGWYSASTRSPSIFEASRIRLWLLGKLGDESVVR